MQNSNSNNEERSLAERFLSEARASRRGISLYLLSGFQLKGEVVEVDSDTILFKHRGVHQLVMRSAVATMYPVPTSNQANDDWWRHYVSEDAQSAEQ